MQYFRTILLNSKYVLYACAAVFLLLSSGIVAHAQEITTINIVTPAWEDQTNEDGTGLYFDIMRAVYEPLGITVSYKFVPWKRAMDSVISLDADALLGEYDNEKLLMPRYPLDIERTSVVFKKDRIAWDGIQTLVGKKVVWLNGYDYHTVSELEGLQYEWDEVRSRENAWKMLGIDRIDFYMDALVDMEGSIEEGQIDMTPYQIETILTTNIYVGFGKSERAERLIEMYDRQIPKLLESGELQKIFEKWEMEFPPFEPEEE